MLLHVLLTPKVGGKAIQTKVVAAAEGEVLVRLVYLEHVMPTVTRLERNYPSCHLQ